MANPKLLDQRLRAMLAGEGMTGGVPSQRGLIRNVMLFCQEYEGQHMMLVSTKSRMVTSPGWRPTYAYARLLQDVIHKISTLRVEAVTEDTRPSSLD